MGDFVEATAAYDLLGNVVARTAEADAGTTLTWTYRYDASELPIRSTFPEGNSIGREYDERNLEFRVTRGYESDVASTTRQDYDLNGNPTLTHDAADNDSDGAPESSRVIYDGFDRAVTEVDAIGNEARRSFDPASNVVTVERWGHPAGDGTAPIVRHSSVRYAVDESGRVLETREELFLAEGFTTARAPDLQDDDGDGWVATRQEYDALSRPTFLVEDDGETSQTIYDGAGRPIETVDALGNRRVVTWDPSSNPVRVERLEVASDGLVADETFASVYVFDQLDRLVRATDNAGQTTRFEYDSRDNLVARSDPEGAPMEDPLGLFPRGAQAGEINEPGNICRFEYDGLDRLRAEVCELRAGGVGGGALRTGRSENPDGEIRVSRAWDGNSRLASVTDDNGNPTHLEYDALDRLAAVEHADGTRESYEYDADDRLLRTTQATGTVVESDYDVLDRITSVAITRGAGVGGSTALVFEYDGLSRLTRSADDNDGDEQECEYVYDSLSRLIEERENNAAVSNVYAGDGRRVSCTYPGGRALGFAHDTLDRVTSIADTGGDIATSAWIVPGHRELRRALANGSRLSYLDDEEVEDMGYDSVQRVVRQRWLDGTGALIVDREYEYNRASHRTEERRLDDDGLTDSYVYDSAYRIVAARFDRDGRAGAKPRELKERAYVLDGAGNRVDVNSTTLDRRKSPASYTANEVNAYTTAGALAYTYNAKGNLTSDGVRTFVYDFANRLVQVENGAGDLLAAYRYFADGRRARRVVYSGSSPGRVTSDTLYLYDGAEVCEERSAATGETEITYIHGPAFVDDLVEMERTADHPLGAARLYYHQNARGDVVAISDEAGEIVDRFRYDDFGAPDATSTAGNRYFFQGRELDAETDLHHFRARTYDSSLGRFLQRDPVWDPANHGNPYTFAGSSPATRRDPLGLRGCDTSGLERELAELIAQRNHALRSFEQSRRFLDRFDERLRQAQADYDDAWHSFMLVLAKAGAKSVLELLAHHSSWVSNAKTAIKVAGEDPVRELGKKAVKTSIENAAKAAEKRAEEEVLRRGVRGLKAAGTVVPQVRLALLFGELVAIGGEAYLDGIGHWAAMQAAEERQRMLRREKSNHERNLEARASELNRLHERILRKARQIRNKLFDCGDRTGRRERWERWLNDPETYNADEMSAPGPDE